MKKVFLFLLVLAVIGVGVGWMMYNKPHENMENAKADMQADAKALFAAFSNDEAGANEKYLNKIVAVSGTVADASKDEGGNTSVMLESEDMMFGVKCELDPLSAHKRTEFQKGEQVTMKCICTGYLSDVVMVRCVETK
ncbi:MAG: hypothetical protein H6577_25635 [Lewinellaceae bacterium]|nr:hypothetical protein [Saprospiraceae bacterium]MCB9341519.1 hypothetical protein [Lewinellaceae bacterium]